MSDRAEAAQLIYKYAPSDTSRNWIAIAQSALTELLNRKEASIRERAILVPIASSCGLEKSSKECIEELIVIGGLKVEDRRTLAKLLSDRGDTKRAKEMLDQINEAEEGAGFLGPWDARVIKDLQGEEHLKRIQALRAFNELEPVVDRLFDARDIVADRGDRQALKLIFDTAHDDQLDANDRLQAIEVMEELGYRDIPLALLPDILAHPEIDDYWAGEVLLRFGNKVAALEYFRKAIKSCPGEYRDQIARSLANLQAVELLQELDGAT